MRFDISKTGRYWVVTDTETGAAWPYLNEAAAQQAAATANIDATTMRDHLAAATESPLPTPDESDPIAIPQEAP